MAEGEKKKKTPSEKKEEKEKVEKVEQTEVTEEPSVTEEVPKEEPKEETPKDGVKIVQTDTDSKTGQVKCPKCGATDISTNIKNGKLRCNFCRHEFEPKKVEGFVEDIKKLEGKILSSGVKDIDANASDLVTLKCTSCGAEVVVDTTSSTQARCHWCRNMLSINNQIPNGAVPDVILPFGVKKEDARYEIERFVGKRKFFANPTFKKEFTTENIMGVYFPYMLVDVNAHASLSGEGEHETKSYWVGDSEHREKRYDADVYHVERDFDITIQGLSVESNSDRLNNTSQEKTNNIINSIMPFDIENCVKFDSNYIKGFSSEKRDVNVDQLKTVVEAQSKDIARFAANDTIKFYDRGVAWSKEDLKVKGEQWKAAYLPVWLYSYQEKKGNKSLLHYVAVNARTKETMGSVPIHTPKLLLISILIEIAAIFGMLQIDTDSGIKYLLLLTGIIYYMIIYSKYRNSGARHHYERETKKEMDKLNQVDDFIRSEHGLDYSRMRGANNTQINGTYAGNDILNTLSNATAKGVLGEVVNKTIPHDDNNNNTIIK